MWIAINRKTNELVMGVKNPEAYQTEEAVVAAWTAARSDQATELRRILMEVVK